MTSVDRLGFYLRLKTEEGIKGTRINFPHDLRFRPRGIDRIVADTYLPEILARFGSADKAFSKSM